MITPERGWNTWHPVSCSRLENLPAGLSIVPGAFSEAESSYTQFPFDTETRLLEHESSGRYCRMRVSHACAEFELEYLRFDAWTILFRMTNLRPPREWGIRYHMLVSIGFENGGAMYVTADGLFGRRDNYSAAVSYAGEPPYDVILAGTADYAGLCMADKGYKSTVSVQNAESAWATCRFVLEQSPQVCLAVSLAHDEGTARRAVDRAAAEFSRWEELRADALRDYPCSTDGGHPHMTEAVSDIMAWNAMHSPELGRAYNAIAKSWNKNFGGWYLFFSDACYQIMLSSLSGDPEMAAQDLDYVLSAATPDGNFTGMLSPYQKWVDRTQPPVLGFSLWMHYLMSGDIAAVERAYPLLRRAQRWYLSRRRDGASPLIRLGTSATGDGSYRGTKLAAKNETAMDNSPMYDEASFDKASGLLEMYDVGVSSQLALDLECTAYMATLLGKESDREELASAAEELRFAINEQLWDEEKGIYANRNTDGTFGLTSPTSFYPLAAGVADSDRVDKCLSHIFNEEEFFTPFPLIAINASHPSGHENRYWRGRTWAPQPFWTYIGLRRCGRDAEAHRLAERAVSGFERHWTTERRSFENYNPFTGEGADTVDSQPFYSWTALFPLMWSLEQFGVTPWDGLFFGMLDGAAFSQKNRLYRGRRYDAVCDGSEMTLFCGGAEIFRSNIPARFRHFVRDDHRASVTVTSNAGGTVSFPGITPRLALVNGVPVTAQSTLSVPGGTVCVELYY